MICRVCHRSVTGETCLAPTAYVGHESYAIQFNCPCGATLAFAMWLSEHEAMLRDYEECRYRRQKAALSRLQAMKTRAAYAG